jgi:hypothetical protein
VTAPAWGRGYAERITPENAAARRVLGSDSTGGIDDWALGNGVLCAVISDPSHESNLTDKGGVLLDLGRCGLQHDQWNSLEMLLNMSQDTMLGATGIRAEPARLDGSVALVATARMLGLAIETHYVLKPERPQALQIETRATRLPPDSAGGPAERTFLFGDVVLHGGRDLAPFTLALDPNFKVLREGSVGFAHPTVNPDEILTMLRAILPANLHVLLGGDTQQPGIAYGLRLVGARLESPEGSSRPLTQFAINGESFTMQGVFSRPLWLGGPEVGWLELAQSLWMDIEVGETLVLEREILVGTRSDVAAVTDQLWPEGPFLRGQTEPAARVHVDTAGGIPITQTRPDADGHFALRTPAPGGYTLRVLAPAGRSLQRMIEVGDQGLELGKLELPAAGRVALPRGRPMRLVFIPAEGSPPPHFGDDLLGFRIGDEEHRGHNQSRDVVLGGIAPDPTEVSLRPGRYRILATRGPEFTLTEAWLDVPASGVVPLVIDSPVRVHEHPGWVTADMHVHSEWSDDSTFPITSQLAAFAAEGADLIVSSEHDRVVDYGPRLQQLGLAARIRSLVGVEVTSSAHSEASPETAGHANVFPHPYDPLAFRGGAVRGEGRRLRAIVSDVHDLPGDALVQLNHPRSNNGQKADLYYFTHLGVAGEAFEPTRPLSAWPNRLLLEPDPKTGVRDIDFDVIELLNGKSMAQYRQVRSDWISLLLQGSFRAAVANSDSHSRQELIAYPRTYVRIAGEFQSQKFVSALRAGQAYGSTGPLLDVALLDPSGLRTDLGGLHVGPTGTLALTVRAAPWVPVSRLQVWWNGEAIHTGDIAAGTPVELPLRFEQDGFVTLEVSGEATGDYAQVARGFVPFAFTNPFFVDADGDGLFTAPGLPEAELPILSPAPEHRRQLR